MAPPPGKGRPASRRCPQAARARSPTTRSTGRGRRASRRASTSSIACSAAASCPARSCCSAASPASASPRCSCRRRTCSARTVGPVLYVSGEESEHQIKLRGERLGVGGGAALPAGRDLPRAHPRGDRARSSRRSLIVDSIQTVFSLEVPVGARQHRPGARGGDAAAVRGQGPRHPDVPRRPRHQGRQPRRARRRSSTSSTPCSTSRARSTSTTASCARSRTASARSASSASSR